jgi:general secretion pathway protein L
VSGDGTGGVAATLHRRGRPPEELLPPGSPPAALAELTARLRPAPALALALPDALTRRVVLPLAAAEGLEEALALDLDRQTPFRPEDVAFTWRVLATDAAERRLTVALTVAPRAALAEAEALAARLGLRLHHALPVAAPPWRDDLLAGRRRAPAPLTAAAMAGAAALLLAAGLVWPVLREERAVAALEAEIAEARRAAAGAAARREAAAARVLPASLAARFGEPATLRLADLSRALPDEAHLRRLVLREGQMEIVGLAPSTAALVVQLASVPGIGPVAYQAPVVASEVAGRELFQLGLAAAAAP